jgi:hypothetical protein
MGATKKIDGQCLNADCFAWVGDVANISTWKICLRVPGNEQKTINQLRGNLSRWPEIARSIPESQRSIVALLLLGACKSHFTVDPSSEFELTLPVETPAELKQQEAEEKSAAAVADLAEERRQQIMQADIEEVESELWRQRAKEQLAELTA